MAITVGVGPARLLYNKSPVWTSVPAPAFTQGTPGFYPITSAMVADADVGDALWITYVGASLSGSGLTFEPGYTGACGFRYSGVGSGTPAGLQLRATDTNIPANSSDSSVFSATITSTVVYGWAAFDTIDVRVGKSKPFLDVYTPYPGEQPNFDVVLNKSALAAQGISVQGGALVHDGRANAGTEVSNCRATSNAVQSGSLVFLGAALTDTMVTSPATGG